MTHQEFLERVKDSLKVDETFYTQWIEPLYMMCGRDKDQFCASFNKWGKYMIDEKDETVFEDWASFYKETLLHEKNVKAERDALNDEIERLQNVMIAAGLEKETGLQTKDLILRKIELGRELTKSQLDFIHDNL